MTITSFSLRGSNPDILTCIANLSNDAVFTPPDFANQMLDTLAKAWSEANNGRSIWADPDVTFLDPFTKSGVFLREITSRLVNGLALTIPDLQKRVDHILTKQVFGIATEQLTALLARRSLYCSKDATGKHSIATSFENPNGNIWFERTEHTWVGGNERVLTADKHGRSTERIVNGRCKYCGANQKAFERDESLETHAYAFIHTDDVKTLISDLFGKNMHFDVIIGNPPYQLSDGGYGTSAAPIYHKFIEQAKNLEPRFLSMVTPARWFVGGKGLDDFRAQMLTDDRIRAIHDYPDSNDVFPGTQIKGGVCYFLWDRDTPGSVHVTTWDRADIISSAARPLLEHDADVFIRYNEGVDVLRKVMFVELQPDSESFSLPDTKRFTSLVSSRKPFGLDTKFKGSNTLSHDDLVLYQNGGRAYVPHNQVTKGIDLINEWKVFIPPLGSGSDSFPHPILGKPFLGAPGSVCTETYLVIGTFPDQNYAQNVISYIATRFFRFLVLLHKPSQHATRSVYTFVPTQDFSRPWSDADLYEKYNLESHEIAFIESMIRPMEIGNE